jgi:2'-5' RNA ligase
MELARIRDHLKASRADARWEPDDKLHCTLKFLGDVPDQIVGPLTDAVTVLALRAGPIEIRYTSVGCFPDRRRPRIVWAGIQDPSGRLTALAGSIDRACAEFGIQREDRPFHPHVTLGRVRSLVSSDDLLSRIESVTFEGPTVQIREIHLVQSSLKPSGSVYKTLQCVPLGSL